MNRLFTELARQQSAALDRALIIGRSSLAAAGRLHELHLAVARAGLDDAATVSLRLLAAPAPAEAAATLTAALQAQADRCVFYCYALREIGRRIDREASRRLLRTDRAA